MIEVSKRVKDRKNKVLHSDKSEAGLLELKPCLTAHAHSLPTCTHTHRLTHLTVVYPEN